jgi:hypothetical protein
MFVVGEVSARLTSFTPAFPTAKTDRGVFISKHAVAMEMLRIFLPFMI